MTQDEAHEQVEAAVAQLLITLAFTIPPRTNLEAAFGRDLINFRKAVAAEATAAERARCARIARNGDHENSYGTCERIAWAIEEGTKP